MRKGVTFIGSLIVDSIKIIDRYPPPGNLCNIVEISRCVGGLAANTSIDLKVLAPELEVAAAGMVGDDESGAYLTGKIASYGIDISGIRKHPSLPTSFTDVMTETDTGVRTFFQAQGACAAFGADDIDFDGINTTNAHVGYALLLNRLDKPDPDFGSEMGRVLRTLRRRGIETSIDLVTETGDRYQTVILPCLPYVDVLFMNEIEASCTTGLTLCDENGLVLEDKARDACAALLARGVQKLVVIHAPQGGWAMTKDGSFFFQPSLRLPDGYIKGTVGAGDAFCAGMLYALANSLGPEEGLRIANLAAAANLSSSNSIDGMKPLAELRGSL